MRKLVRIALLAGALLALILIAVVVGMVLPDRPGVPAGPQAALDAFVLYINNDNGIQGDELRAIEVLRGDRPGRLTTDTPSLSFGESVYYGTDVRYDQNVLNTALPTAIGGGFGARPLPYPPEQVWCAVVEPRAETGRGVVLVALHQDIHNADWIVHQAIAGPFSQQALDLAAEVGCQVE